MSKRGRRERKPRGPHTDKYAAKARQSQAELAAFNEQWEKEHPVTASPATSDISESEERA
jgi:hypothetical protein